MRHALLAAALTLMWPLGAMSNTPSTDTDSRRSAGDAGLSRAPLGEPRNNAVHRVARDESIRWSEPFYRYGQRDPALEELAIKGDSPESGTAAHPQPPH